jgi:hypothetical protein
MMKGSAPPLRAFLDQVRINPRFVANCAAQPNLERAFANTEYFFSLLERETKPVSVQLRACIEEIIDGDGSLSEKCDHIECAIRNALPEIQQTFRN